LLAVLPIPGLIAPLVLDSSVLSRDYPIMTALTLLLGVAMILAYRRVKSHSRPASLGRKWGAFLLICCLCYYTLITLTIG
jgi:cation:H+ antiporter